MQQPPVVFVTQNQWMSTPTQARLLRKYATLSAIVVRNSAVVSLPVFLSVVNVGVFGTELLRERVNEFLTQIDIAMETAA